MNITEMGFSPAPWRITRSKKAKHRDAVFIQAADDSFVGKVYGHDGEPVEANARLVAAAPELLDELQMFLDNVSQAADLFEDGDKEQAHKWIASACVSARTVIGKVTK